MSKTVKVAIAGVGNCASSLVQGVFYYKEVDLSKIHGIMFPKIGDYKPSDIEFVAAWDVDARKVGKDLSEAIFSPPNCTTIFYRDVPKLNVKVRKGKVLDGVANHMSNFPVDKSFQVSPEKEDSLEDMVAVLKETQADVLINYVPVGSEQAARFYAEVCLKAGVAFVNAMPTFIVSDPEWGARFEKEGIPAVGDDIKSQLGATILHRTLVQLFIDRGIPLKRTYQLNFGGNTDFLNMLERDRLKTKKISKTEAVTSLLPYDIGWENVHIGPSDWVPWLKDKKIAYIRLEGEHFGGVPLSVEVKLEVEDSPNSAGSALDAIRCAKLAKDRGIGGPLLSISAYTMKHPPKQFPDHIARQMVLEFIEGKRER
ncbi:inositol-3-phosphate synthase [Thermodesulfobacterium sp.]|jgi:myo-inositol-1-phosphate synthase|uniref:inositol-3-phosphate synthase n=1 Tax=Thermodesulfobacterium sp. TaxID=1965289 RepID=UPI002648328E|nr:inositol-3-phosphate synthase [Thermodesulfobacterium sp.]MDN5380265.1 myo-inositol-phosphate synthase [Thermodesulfobacterium sp.]